MGSIVCCDEIFFASLAANAMPLVNLVKLISQTPTRWYGYVKDRGSLGVVDMVVEMNEFLCNRSGGCDRELRKWAGVVRLTGC
jgi:hypothetical protein